jgi:TonB family protein
LRDQVSSCIDSDGYPSAAQRNERTSKGLGAPPCAFNFERLGECLRRIKEEYPEDSQIIVTADPSVDHQILVRALDVARNPSTSSERLGPTYTEPYGYDALAFADVFLFTGENLEQSCHQPRPTAPDEGPIGLGKLPTIGFGGPSVPAIRIGTAEVRGSLSKEVIRRYIRRNINQVRYCYERQLAGHPELEGNVQIRFIISPSGAVTSSSVASSTLGDSEVEECVARTIQRIAFPEPEGGGVVIVTYPFRFQTAE